MTVTVRPLTHNQPYSATALTTVSACAAKVAMSSSVARQTRLSDRKWKMHAMPAREAARTASAASHQEVDHEVEGVEVAAAVVLTVTNNKSSTQRTLQN